MNTEIMTANSVVHGILLGHMGLAPRVSYRLLFANNGSMSFASMKHKKELLHEAVMTGCTEVIMDVLLFLSQTMSEVLLHQEIARHLVVLDHWANYLRQQQRINKVVDSIYC